MKSKAMKMFFKGLLLLVCLSVFVKGAQAGILGQIDTIKTQNGNLSVGKPLPNISVHTAKGDELKPSSIKGKVVLIDFWASWCMPCRASIPHLKALYQKYHDMGFEILSISIDQNNKAWVTAMLKETMPWQQAIDRYPDGKDLSVLTNALGIKSVPFVIVLGPDGKVLQVNPSAKEIDNILERTFTKTKI
jgi:thiol-disulfide isomerase/thioredoxin